MDTRTAERKLNQFKAKREQRQGPAGHSQEDAPILDALREFHARETLSLAIPAHKSGAGAPPEALAALGERVFAADLVSLGGLDNRHSSWEIQSAAQELAAEALGAEGCLFSTNGSTTSVHACMTAVVGPGEEIAISRNSHKSAITGLIHTGAVPVWLEPEYDADLEIAHGVTPETLTRTLAAHPDCRAVFITTPSYYGMAADVEQLARVAHVHELPLVTDDAWALADRFHPELPAFPLELGADLVIGSVHKTLGALGQTSIISFQGPRVDPERLSLALEMFQSTSGSSVLLASIDAARRQMVREGEALLGRALASARRLRAAARDLGLPTLEPSDMRTHPSIAGVNELHVTIDVSSLGITGYKAADWLRDHHDVAVELGDHRRVMAIVSHADNAAGIDRAVEALTALVAAFSGRSLTRAPREVPRAGELRTEQVMTPREAFFAAAESVALDEAPGRVAAEFLTPYPPGIPLLAPGERVTDAIVDYLTTGAAEGMYAEGCVDQSLSSLRVVA